MATRWSKLEIKIKTGIEGDDDLEAKLWTSRSTWAFEWLPSPQIIFVNTYSSLDYEQWQSLHLVLDDIELLRPEFLDRDLSELMMKRERWYGDEPKWAVFNTELKMVSSGTGLPSKAELQELVSEMKNEELRSLQRFVREYPNQYDAKVTLIHHLRDIALEKTKEKLLDCRARGVEMALSSEDDLLIWGEFARLFRELVHYYSRNNFYYYLPYGMPLIMEPGNEVEYLLDGLKYKLFDYSPTMNALANELLPVISDGINSQPENKDYWKLWAFLAAISSKGQQVWDLLDGLVVSPYGDKSNLPPYGILEYLVANHRYENNWQGIEDLLEKWWESMIANGKLYETNVSNAGNVKFIPLLEAHLFLNHESKVKNLLDSWKLTRNWEQGKPQVKKLFERFGREYKD
ncbi:MAG: hypothetical protein FWG02_00355 [Holophagaceae bacterium]|nr:hypothetical protein [Holophagaceae bacterium]